MKGRLINLISAVRTLMRSEYGLLGVTYESDNCARLSSSHSTEPGDNRLRVDTRWLDLCIFKTVSAPIYPVYMYDYSSPTLFNLAYSSLICLTKSSTL